MSHRRHRMSRRCRKSVAKLSQWCREMSRKCHKNVTDLSRAVTKCHKASQPRTSPDISRRGWPPLPPPRSHLRRLPGGRRTGQWLLTAWTRGLSPGCRTVGRCRTLSDKCRTLSEVCRTVGCQTLSDEWSDHLGVLLVENVGGTLGLQNLAHEIQSICSVQNEG